MNMEQLKTIFKEQGLTVHVRKRRKGTPYIYAAWREQGKLREVYVAPQAKMLAMQEEQVHQELAAIKQK